MTRTEEGVFHRAGVGASAGVGAFPPVVQTGEARVDDLSLGVYAPSSHALVIKVCGIDQDIDVATLPLFMAHLSSPDQEPMAGCVLAGSKAKGYACRREGPMGVGTREYTRRRLTTHGVRPSGAGKRRMLVDSPCVTNEDRYRLGRMQNIIDTRDSIAVCLLFTSFFVAGIG